MNLRAAIAPALLACMAFCTSLAQAQVAGADFPNKPIHVIVPFPPGGSSDAVVRMLVPRLAERLGAPVIVDNRPGAGGNIGLAATAKRHPTATPWAWAPPAAWRPTSACIRNCPTTR